MSSDVFQSLWIGPQLSSMEVLSIESFLHFGYQYHLYAYEEVANVPRGVTLCDANEIIPESEIFYHRGNFAHGSPACFADQWRYKLLFDRGGWWVDTDVVCVRPLEFDGAHVVGSHRELNGRGINCAVMRMPSGSSLAQHCYEICVAADRDKLRWDDLGPKLVKIAIENLDMGDCVEAPKVFYDIDYWDIGELFEDHELPAEACCVHLWHTMWAHHGIDSGGVFPSNCLYERLRRSFLPNYESPPLTDRENRRISAKLADMNLVRRNKPRHRARRLASAILLWRRSACSPR